MKKECRCFKAHLKNLLTYPYTDQRLGGCISPQMELECKCAVHSLSLVLVPNSNLIPPKEIDSY